MIRFEIDNQYFRKDFSPCLVFNTLDPIARSGQTLTEKNILPFYRPVGSWRAYVMYAQRFSIIMTLVTRAKIKSLFYSPCPSSFFFISF